MSETHPAGATVVKPAQPAASNDPSPVPDDTVIQMALSVGQINYLLALLGERPLKESMGLFSILQGQGNMAIAAMKMRGGNGTAQVAVDPPAAPSADVVIPGETPPAPEPTPRRGRNKKH